MPTVNLVDFLGDKNLEMVEDSDEKSGHERRVQRL